MPRAMLHDEAVYPDPFTFNPDRFINPETGQIDHTRARDPSHACWGFGRRICPGRYMAFSAVWLTIASLIATFDIEKAKEKVKVVGEDGIEKEEERTVELTHEYISALVM
jgi:cytochrome P450